MLLSNLCMCDVEDTESDVEIAVVVILHVALYIAGAVERSDLVLKTSEYVCACTRSFCCV